MTTAMGTPVFETLPLREDQVLLGRPVVRALIDGDREATAILEEDSASLTVRAVAGSTPPFEAHVTIDGQGVQVDLCELLRVVTRCGDRLVAGGYGDQAQAKWEAAKYEAMRQPVTHEQAHSVVLNPNYIESIGESFEAEEDWT